jgi:hypothetical protein
MKKIKNYKSKILVCLILLQSFLAFGIYLIPAHGDENIPEDSPNNDWYWDINVGEKLIFEIERTSYNQTTQEFINTTKFLITFNITSFENVSFDSGFYTEDMSKINVDLLFWNASSSSYVNITSYDNFAYFGYNESDSSLPEKYFTQNSLFAPLILPINGSGKGLEIQIIGDIINKSLLYQLSFMGYLDALNESSYSSAPNNHQVVFENKQLGYYFNLTYFDNGTLKFGDIKFHEKGTNSIIEQKLTRVFSSSDIDRVNWPKSIGDEYIYDAWGEGSSDKLKLKVKAITNRTESFFFDGLDYYRNFESIIGDFYFWNGTDYELDNTNVLLGEANNFYVANPREIDEVYTLFPEYTTKLNLEYIFNDNIDKVFPNTFDEGEIIETGTQFIISLNQSSANDLVNITINKTTNTVVEIKVIEFGGLGFYLTEPMTDIDWGYQPGDIVYAKINDANGKKT